MKIFIIPLLVCLSSLATAHQGASLSLCPQGAENTMAAFQTTSLTVNNVEANTAYNSSEPNFSAKILWLQNGDVVLVRNGKNSILLGHGQRPAQSEGCDSFAFDLNESLQILTRKIVSSPHPISDPYTGTRIVKYTSGVIDIKTDDEQIEFRGETAAE